MSLNATIRNAPDYPPTGEIAVYNAPASGTRVFTIANGAGPYTVTSLAEDPIGATFNGQPYLWFQMQFPGGMTGWVRDEYIDLEGDGSAFGIGKLPQKTSAFTLIHGAGSMPTEATPAAEIDTAAEPDNPTTGDLDRLLRVALDITATFEGGYSSYQNTDTGIVSYGRFQFTLAGGALFKVVNLYLQNSTTDEAQELRNSYLGRIRSRDETLRDDDRLKALLRAAAREAAMQQAQNAIAKEKYWDLVQELSIKPRNVQTPLGQALIFDMAINHGARHDMLTLAEEALGVPARSKMPDNGAKETDFIAKVADIRKERMYALADKYGWGGLRVRADFWVNTIAAGDWQLEGDANGEIHPKSKRVVNAS